jgi:hypothetical protein
MLNRKWLGATTIALALLAFAFALPAHADPVTLLDGGVTGTTSYYNPYPSFGTRPLDMALTIKQEVCCGMAINQWDFHWKDDTVELVEKNEFLVRKLYGFAYYPGTTIPVSHVIDAFVTDVNDPSRKLRAVVRAAKGYVWDQGTTGRPDYVSLNLYECLGGTWTLIHQRDGWMGTYTAGVWTGTGGWTTLAAP